MRSPRIFFVLVLMCIFSVTTSAFSDYHEFKFTTGFDYSSGDYGGTSDTDILYIPFTGKYMTNQYSFKMTIPYLSITSDEAVLTSGGEVIITSQGTIITEQETESGMGDITATFSYYLLEETESHPMVDLNAKIKFGTADKDKGLGTEETDFAFEADVATVKDANTYFGTLGYKFYGDTPMIDFDDVFYVNLGFSHRFNREVSGGLMYDFREKTTSNGNNLSELTAYSTYRINKDYKLMGYLVAGLSDGSPDFGIGVTISRLFGLEDIKESYRYIEKFRFW